VSSNFKEEACAFNFIKGGTSKSKEQWNGELATEMQQRGVSPKRKLASKEERGRTKSIAVVKESESAIANLLSITQDRREK
jgi:hypothetical protein